MAAVLKVYLPITKIGFSSKVLLIKKERMKKNYEEHRKKMNRKGLRISKEDLQKYEKKLGMICSDWF